MRFIDLCWRSSAHRSGAKKRFASLHEFAHLWQQLRAYPKATLTITRSLAKKFYNGEKGAKRAQSKTASSCPITLVTQGFKTLAKCALKGKPPQRQCEGISDEEFGNVKGLFPPRRADHSATDLATECEDLAKDAVDMLSKDASHNENLRGNLLHALLHAPHNAGAGPNGLKFGHPHTLGMNDHDAARGTEMLDQAFDVEPNSRLSCQIILNKDLEGLKLTLAPDGD